MSLPGCLHYKCRPSGEVVWTVWHPADAHKGLLHRRSVKTETALHSGIRLLAPSLASLPPMAVFSGPMANIVDLNNNQLEVAEYDRCDLKL